MSLESGRSKQIWLTVKVPEQAKPGLYKGALTLTADGKPAGEMALNLNVLPFTLPDPKTYYDLDRDYIVTMDGLGTLKMELEGIWERSGQGGKKDCAPSIKTRKSTTSSISAASTS